MAQTDKTTGWFYWQKEGGQDGRYSKPHFIGKDGKTLCGNTPNPDPGTHLMRSHPSGQCCRICQQARDRML